MERIRGQNHTSPHANQSPQTTAALLFSTFNRDNNNSDPTTMATPVTVEPAALQVPAGGGTSQHALQNTGEGRFAFKIKSTNNDHYRVNPVFGFVEPGASAQVEVTRLAGPPKSGDRLEILFMAVEADAADPKAPFAGGTPEFKLEVPMNAE